MKLGWLRVLGAIVLLGSAALAHAQGGGGRPPGGMPGGRMPAPPPPSMGGGMPGGPGPSGRNGERGNVPSGTSTTPKVSNVTRNGVKLGPPGRWWDDHSFAQQIGLRKDQQKAMDAVLNAHKGAIVSAYDSYVSEQAKLDKLSKQPNVDKAQLFAAIDSTNQARSALEKANTEMLLEIRSKLDPEQTAKLEQLP